MSQSHTAWHEQTRPPHERPRTRVVVLGSEPIETCFEGVDGTEVIAVRTVLELVGETGSIDTGEPERVIACIAEACVTPPRPHGQPQEPHRLPRAEPIEPVIEALRVAEPNVRVVLVRTGEQPLEARGFDAIVREDDDPETIRAAAFGETSPCDQTQAHDQTPAHEPVGPIRTEPGRGGHAHEDASRSFDPIEAGEPVGPVGPGAREAAVSEEEPAAEDAIEPEFEIESPDFSTEPAGADEPVGTTGASGEQKLAMVAASGGDVRAEALRMINVRWARSDPTGRASIELRRRNERIDERGDPGILRAPVLWNGRSIGTLEVVPADADAAEAIRANGPVSRRLLEAEADWLAPWLALWRRSRAMRRAAMRDPLTGAYNRRYFLWYMEKAIEIARDRRIPLTVLVFDIDHFKRYNDEYGHAAGDEILTESVRALRSVIRPTDRVCRIGGDEFVVIFFEPHGPRRMGSSPPDDVQVLARRVQERICRRRFPKLGEQARGPLTISGGLATYPWDGQTAEQLYDLADQMLPWAGRDWRELLDHADGPMMASKRQGKNAIKLGRGLEDICEPPGPEITVRPRAERAARHNRGPGGR